MDVSSKVIPHTVLRRSLISAVRSSSRRRLARGSLVIPCTHKKLNVKLHRTSPKPEIHTSITADKDEAALARKKSTETYTGGAAEEVRVYKYVCLQARTISSNPGRMEEACEYGLTRGTRFVARRTPSRGRRGRRADVDWFRGVFFQWLVAFRDFCFRCFVFSNAHGLLQVRVVPCLMYLSTSTGVRTGCQHLICPSVCLCLSVYVLQSSSILFARAVRGWFIQRSMEAGGYGLTRGTCVVARLPEMVAVAGLL